MEGKFYKSKDQSKLQFSNPEPLNKKFFGAQSTLEIRQKIDFFFRLILRLELCLERFI